MTLPTRLPVRIYVAAQNITNYVPPDSLSIEYQLHQPARARFRVEDASGFTFARYQRVVIVAPDLSAQYFRGYVTEFPQTKYQNGIQIVYEIEAASDVMRLQKSFVTGATSGTDAQILSNLLGDTKPTTELANLFDFTTNVTSVLGESIDFNVQDTNLLEAVTDLGNRTGANWDLDTGINDAFRSNLFYNPDLNNNADYFNDDPVQAPGAWVAGSGSYNATGGEDGGGCWQITSQSIPPVPTDQTWTLVGRTTPTGTLTIPVVRTATTKYLNFQIRGKIDAGANVSVVLHIRTYDANGDFYASDAEVVPTFSAAAWQNRYDGWDLSSEALFPVEGFCDFAVDTARASGSYTLFLDRVLIEVKDDISEGFYFDGETTGAEWLGTANDSPSIIIDNPLQWGDTPPSAPFDLDIGVGDELVADLELDFPAFDGINAIVVTGGYEYVDILFEYPGDGQLTHFDLQTRMFPRAGSSNIEVDKNTGTDVSPVWTAVTVNTPPTEPSGNNVIWYDFDDNSWLWFGTAPPDLKRSWRLTARIKKRVRVEVQDSDSIDRDGITLYDTIYDDSIDSSSEAASIANQELANRTAPVSTRFTTYEPGLLPGQALDVTDSTRSVAETSLIVQRVGLTFLGGGYVKYDVEAGAQQTDLVDILVDTRRRATKRPSSNEAVTSTILTPLVDEDGSYQLDENGAVIYDEVQE